MSNLKVIDVDKMADVRSLSGQFYRKSEVDEVIAEKDTENEGLKADYDEIRGRLQTANLIKDEQKAKADKLLSCLKCLVMRDLIKDCREKDSAIEIVKEYDLWWFNGASKTRN